MKTLFAFVAIVTLTCVPAFAKTVDFPNEGDVMFTISIPDSWEPDSDEDDVVEATSPKEHVSLAIWEIKTKDELKNLGKDIVDILENHAKEIKLEGEPKEISPGGMEGLLFSGSAVDEDDDHAIEFFALLIVSKKKVAVLFIEADADTPKKEFQKLLNIIKSIKQPSSK